MEFFWLNKQGVESSDGFIVQRKDRFFYHYIERGKILKIPVENGLVDDLYLNTEAKWDVPFENEKITGEDVDRIQANLFKAMEFMKLPSRIIKRKYP